MHPDTPFIAIGTRGTSFPVKLKNLEPGVSEGRNVTYWEGRKVNRKNELGKRANAFVSEKDEPFELYKFSRASAEGRIRAVDVQWSFGGESHHGTAYVKNDWQPNDGQPQYTAVVSDTWKMGRVESKRVNDGRNANVVAKLAFSEEPDSATSLDKIRKSVGFVEEITKRLFKSKKERLEGLRFFADSVRFANQIEPNRWSITAGLSSLRLIVGLIEVVWAREGEFQVMVSGSLTPRTLKSFGQIDPRIPFYESVPDSCKFFCSPARLGDALELLRPAHEALLRAAATKPLNPSSLNSYSPAVIEYLSKLFSETFAHPEHWTNNSPRNPRLDSIDELRELQAGFESKRQEGKGKRKKLELLGKKFTSAYPLAKLQSLTLDEFVQGKGDKSTFCYRLERETAPLGHIQGSPAIKFGIYFDKKGGSYRFKGKHSQADEALRHILAEYTKLLKAAEKLDFDEIRKVDVTPMVKGKLLFLYFPDRFLNTFSERHVDYFLTRLRLNDPSAKLDLIEKKELLWELKCNDEVFSKWSTLEFTEFLYTIWSPPSRHATQEAPQALKTFLLNLPDPEETQPEFIDLDLGTAPRPAKTREQENGARSSLGVNFQEKSRRNKIVGDYGEDIVFLAEKRALIRAGHSNLAQRVKAMCKVDDAAGYDILSFETDGTEKYIEVKTTTAKAPQVGAHFSFYLSANELAQSRHYGRKFHIYIVFDANSETPKILCLSNPAKMEKEKFLLEPTAYRASLCVSSA